MSFAFSKSCFHAVLLAAFLAVALAGIANGQSARSIRLGPIMQKNAVLQPGIEVGYADADRLPRQLQLSFAYMSTRLAAAFGSNGLVEDRLLVGAAWMLRPRRIIKPFAQLEVGYTRFNREDGVIFALLDNNAFIASVLLGLDVQLRNSPFSVQADAGYSILQSSTVYPFVTSVGVYYRISP